VPRLLPAHRLGHALALGLVGLPLALYIVRPGRFLLRIRGRGLAGLRALRVLLPALRRSLALR